MLKRLYGAKSEKLSHDQLLLTFLEDEALGANERLELIADPADAGPAATISTKKTRAKRTNKLSDSLKGLPTTERIIIDPEARKNPDLYRFINSSPQSFVKARISKPMKHPSAASNPVPGNPAKATSGLTIMPDTASSSIGTKAGLIPASTKSLSTKKATPPSAVTSKATAYVRIAPSSSASPNYSSSPLRASPTSGGSSSRSKKITSKSPLGSSAKWARFTTSSASSKQKASRDPPHPSQK